MKKIVFWSLLILCVSTLVNQSQAETTSDNLLDNGDFSTGDLSGWTVEDSGKIQYDGNCYNESGLCQSVRWSTDLGKTLSQTIEDLSEGYDIDTIHLDFTALGCNNEATGAWCSEGTDYDKVQAVIQLSDGTNTENLYLEQTLDYNDGTKDYGLSTQTLDAWTTDDTSINFSITGIDTGNLKGQFGPIVDNLSLYLTMTETPVPVVIEPIVEIKPEVIEPIVEIKPEVIEPIVEIKPEVIEPVEEVVVIEETTVIEGLDLKTEIVTDVIIDTPVEKDMSMDNLPKLPELPTIEVEVPTVIEVPQEIEVVEEIQEIQEIKVEVEEVAEVTEEVVEQPEELKEHDMEEDLAKADEVEETESSEEEEKAKSEQETEVAESKDEPKPQAKSEPKQPKSEVSEAPKENTGFEQVDISTMIGLQVIPQTITIQETVSLTQEMIYEQDIGALASSDAYNSLIGGASSRWVRMVDVRPKHTFSGYGR
jgi:hypothetical protein